MPLARCNRFQILFVYSSMKGITVAVVDDDAISMDIIVEGLENRLGATVFAFSRSKVALEFLQKQTSTSLDIVISDLTMPDFTGLDLLTECRKEGRYVPFIMLTANATLDVVKQARALNVNEFLAKPVAIDDLITKIERVTECQK